MRVPEVARRQGFRGRAGPKACRQGDADAYPERRVGSAFGVMQAPRRPGDGGRMRVLGCGVLERKTWFAVRSCVKMGGGVVNESRSGRGVDAFEPAGAGEEADRIDVK